MIISLRSRIKKLKKMVFVKMINNLGGLGLILFFLTRFLGQSKAKENQKAKNLLSFIKKIMNNDVAE